MGIIKTYNHPAVNIIKNTLRNWWGNDPLTNSAATAYYALFSMPGLIIIVMAVATLFVEKRIVEIELLYHLQSILGDEIASTILNIVNQTRQENKSLIALVLGLFTLGFAATGLFAQLQKSLNRVWQGAKKRKKRVPQFIRNRVVSFGMILVIGFLLLTSLMMTALLNYFADWLTAMFGQDLVVFVKWIDFAVSFGIVTLLFSVMFKMMPDTYVRWRYAIWGGILSTALFNIGEYAINYYFQLAEPASAFGAAGSLVLLLLWVSYSCLILLIGAEFSKSIHDQVETKKT
jgi:membrane protein